MEKHEYFRYLNEKQLNMAFKPLEDYALEHHVPIMQQEGIGFLTHLIHMTQAKRILEIGTAIGYSALRMATLDPSIHVTTIERDEIMYEEAKKNIHDFQCDLQITLIFGNALDVAINGEFDLCFIDAAKGQYQKFFEKYSPLVKQKGLIVTDNLIFHDLIFSQDITNRNTRQLVQKIKNYNEWLRNNETVETYFYQLGDGIAVSIKK